MLTRLFAVAVAVLIFIVGPARADEDLSGTWIWSVEGRNVFVLHLSEGEHGLWGSMDRPTQVLLVPGGDGPSVTEVRMPVVRHELEAAGVADGGHLLRWVAPDPDQSRTYVLRPGENGEAVLALGDDPGAPTLPLHRPRPATEVFTDWREGQTYSSSRPAEASNTELAALFEADQAARRGGSDIDWSVVMLQDAERRARTREMLDAGQINSAQDYYHAAFIFQHGGEPDDYLLAHVLAVTAVGKGHPRAPWIAAATLDRYLQNIGRAQIYGTQFLFPHGGEVGQGEYDRELLPDAVRAAAGVRTLAEQEDQRRRMQDPVVPSSTGD